MSNERDKLPESDDLGEPGRDRASSSAVTGETDEMDPAVPSEADLWRRAHHGPDPESALGALYDLHSGLVYGLALKILRNPAEAEDLTQEVFVALCGDESPYDPSRGSLGAYLTVFTRSRAIDRLRRGSRRRQAGTNLRDGAIPLPDQPSPFDLTSNHERAERVSAAFEALSDRQRQALELAYYRGLTQTEIATELDAPLGTVKSLVRGALLHMRRTLGDLVK